MRSIGLRTNPKLKRIDALGGVNELGSLTIIGNPKLESLHGLHNVRSFGGDSEVIINNNESLRDLSGLEGLKSSESYMQIIYNRNLASAEGLHNLESAYGLMLRGNAELVELSGGLSSLQQIDWMSVEDNPKLDPCEIEEALEGVEITEKLTVAGNAGEVCSAP